MIYRAASLLALALAAALGAAASLAQPSNGVEVVSDLYQEIEAAPGQSYTRDVLVKNSGDQRIDVRISVQEFASRLNGVNNYSPTARHARSNADWVALPLTIVSLEPGEVRPVSFSVHVPEADAADARQGTYWSALIIEPADLAAAPAAAPEGRVSIRSRIRFAVHVAVQLPGGEPAVRLLGAELVDGAEGRFIALDVENAGDRVVRPEAWAELYQTDGTPLDRVDGNRPLLYPGNQATLRVPLAAVALGQYTGMLFIDGGTDMLIGQRIDLDITAPAPAMAEGSAGR
jgi:hypothetical protein